MIFLHFLLYINRQHAIRIIIAEHEINLFQCFVGRGKITNVAVLLLIRICIDLEPQVIV